MAFEEHTDDPGFGDGDSGPIDAAEREALHQDLHDVKTLKAVLASRGLRGVVVFCPDCDDDHYLGWDLLAGNLQQILDSGTTPVHEPAWDPDPDEYVSWEYARGFLDGYETLAEERQAFDVCSYCGSELPQSISQWTCCPYCSKDFAPLNLLIGLRRRGWTEPQILAMMEDCGFEIPTFDPEDSASPFPIDAD